MHDVSFLIAWNFFSGATVGENYSAGQRPTKTSVLAVDRSVRVVFVDMPKVSSEADPNEPTHGIPF